MSRSRELAELASSYDSGSPLGFRNRIINGDMRIDQRNNGASVTPTISGLYTIDRWACNIAAASKFSVQQNAGAVTPPAGFSNYLGVTSLSAYSVAAGEFFCVIQNIEGFNIADLAWGTASAQAVTLSFQVRSSLTGTFGGSLRNGTAARSYPFTFSIPAANTWTSVSVTIAGDTTGTWATGNTGGLVLTFGLGVGATFSGAAGTWVSGNLQSATGATSVVGTNGATWFVTGIQLEAGTVATPFERVDYSTQLMRCQRYYETGYSAAGSRSGDNIAVMIAALKQTKRASPTMTYTVSSGGSVTTGPTSAESVEFFNSAVAGGSGRATWFASAEL